MHESQLSRQDPRNHVWLDDRCQAVSMVVEVSARHPDEISLSGPNGFRFDIDAEGVVHLRDFLSRWLDSQEDL